MKECVIFDLDGTIANCDHRLGYLRTSPKNWQAFWAGTRLDEKYEAILHIFKMYLKEDIPVIIVTARSEESRSCTEWWLANVAEVTYDKLYMRTNNDFRPDTIVKKEILDQMRQEGYNPFIVFEDRDAVVKMWREQGLVCVQVKDGNY